MGNRYLVVSDLHLCDVEDHPDGWKRYKSAAFVFDDQFAALVETFRAAGDGEPTLVLVVRWERPRRARRRAPSTPTSTWWR